MRKYFKVGEKAGLLDDQGKQLVHQTSMPMDMNTFYTGVDDNDVFLELVHGASDPIAQSIYADFNGKQNENYLHEALVQWSGALRDCISADIVTGITTTSAGSDYGITSGSSNERENGIILPGPVADNLSITKDKTFTNTDAKPIQLIKNAVTGVMPQGFWDIGLDSNGDYDFATLTPNYNATGGYNLYDSEKALKMFVRKIPMMGSTAAWNVLPSSDTARLGDGMRIRMTFDTRGTNHAWECSVAIIMHRKETVL